MEDKLFEESSGNVYADLVIKDADEMLRNAKLMAAPAHAPPPAGRPPSRKCHLHQARRML